MLYWIWETSSLKVCIGIDAQSPLLPEEIEKNTDMMNLEKLLTFTSWQCA
jgi:hypothetical protein